MSYWLEQSEIDALYEGAKDLFFGLYRDWRQGLKPDLSVVSPERRDIVDEAIRSLDRGNALTEARDIAAAAYRIQKRRQKAAALAAQDGTCPKCGERGTFIRAALCCSRHGAFAGI